MLIKREVDKNEEPLTVDVLKTVKDIALFSVVFPICVIYYTGKAVYTSPDIISTLPPTIIIKNVFNNSNKK